MCDQFDRTLHLSHEIKIIKDTKNLVIFKVRVEGFLLEISKVPCLKDAIRRWHRAFLRKDLLILNEQTCDLECWLNNIHFGAENGSMHTAVDNRLVRL